MRGGLFSPLWYRAAALQPCLHTDVHVERQSSRGQTWYLLSDASSGRQFRLNPEAYAVIGRLNGTCTVQAAWDAVLDAAGDAAPTQDEVLQLLTQMTERGLLESGVGTEGTHQPKARRGLRRWLNPFAFSIPFGDPSALLRRLDFLRAAGFLPGMVWLWLAVVGGAAAAAARNWGELGLAVQGTRWPWLVWLVFPFLKAAHELAHALAVRQFGGEVHKAGLTLFLLTPAPYVDASAASGFRSRRQRLVVGVAGVATELALAAIALLLWLNLQPGWLRDLAFAALFTASVSTLFFNANPLLRFDAYYVLCDLLDLPNLGPRSAAWWGQLMRRLLRTEHGDEPLMAGVGETKWLVAYAPLSFACRLVLGLGIVLWLGGLSAVLGCVGASLYVVSLLTPLWRAARQLLAENRHGYARLRVACTVSICGATLLVLLFMVPLPAQTAAMGVVWLPDQARVRAETGGFIAQLHAANGARVQAGQLLFELSDPALTSARERLRSRLAELGAERFAALGTQKLERVGEYAEEIVRTEAELGRVEQRIAGLNVRSNVDGTLVLSHSEDLPGMFVERGATLGHVLDREQIVVRTAIEQQDAAQVRERTRAITVRLAEAPDAILDALTLREVPAAGMELPSPALGDTAGGPHVTDPTDKKGLRLLQPVVWLDLKLPAQNLERVGGRAWVLFDHGREPLATQLYRRSRQLLLARFNPVQ